MRRDKIRAGVALLVILAGCSSSAGHPASSTSTTAVTSTSRAEVTTTNATTVPPAPSTTLPTGVTTTAAATTGGGCPPSGGPTAPFSTPSSNGSALLNAVSATGLGCTDRVVFSFIVKSGGTPSCQIAYKNGPFSQDASGAPVAVAGAAFVVLRCSPAYGYDFESGRTTYTGPKRITPAGTAHVRELVETGDFEGVVTWVVGLDAPVGFHVVAATIPPGISTIAITFQ